LRFGLRLDQVGEAFGFGEVDPPILEGSPGEFTGKCFPQATESRQATKNGVDHRPSAMALKLNDIFASGARRGIKPEHQSFVEQLAGRGMPQLANGGAARLRQGTRDSAAR